MKKNKLFQYLLTALLSLCISILLQGQETSTHTFDCECAGISVSITPSSHIICTNESVTLTAAAVIEETTGITIESYSWLHEGKPVGEGEEIEATLTGVYTLKVEDSNGCITRETISLKNPEDYFKDNCFISIPINGYERTGVGGSGVQQSANSRSSMDGLMIDIEPIGRVDLNTILGNLSNEEIAISENCEELGSNITDNNGGLVAHVTDGLLYLGANNGAGNNEEIVNQFFEFWKTTGEGTEEQSLLGAPINYSCSDQFFKSDAFPEWIELFLILVNCDPADT